MKVVKRETGIMDKQRLSIDSSLGTVAQKRGDPPHLSHQPELCSVCHNGDSEPHA
jgi:hypothetical protein